MDTVAAEAVATRKHLAAAKMTKIALQERVQRGTVPQDFRGGWDYSAAVLGHAGATSLVWPLSAREVAPVTGFFILFYFNYI